MAEMLAAAGPASTAAAQPTTLARAAVLVEPGRARMRRFPLRRRRALGLLAHAVAVAGIAQRAVPVGIAGTVAGLGLVCALAVGTGRPRILHATAGGTRPRALCRPARMARMTRYRLSGTALERLRGALTRLVALGRLALHPAASGPHALAGLRTLLAAGEARLALLVIATAHRRIVVGHVAAVGGVVLPVHVGTIDVQALVDVVFSVPAFCACTRSRCTESITSLGWARNASPTDCTHCG